MLVASMRLFVSASTPASSAATTTPMNPRRRAVIRETPGRSMRDDAVDQRRHRICDEHREGDSVRVEWRSR